MSYHVEKTKPPTEVPTRICLRLSATTIKKDATESYEFFYDACKIELNKIITNFW